MITGTHTSRRLTLASGTFAGLLILAGASAAEAQDTGNNTASSDARWQAYVGCWAPSDSQAQGGVAQTGAQTPLVCVIPAGGQSAVEIVTLVDGNVTTRQRIEATGAQRQATRDGCTGWESAQWSPGGERVYLRSDFACDGGVKRASNGVLSITPSGEWLDVQGVAVGANKGVRVVRYREVLSPTKVPADVQSALAARTHANTLMRTAAAVDLGTEDVIEATRVLDPIVVETWLVERGQGFGTDAKQLVELSKAGVPGSVTDVMVALSYPLQFAINLAMRGGETRTVQSGAAGEETQVAGNYNGPHMMWDPFWMSSSRYGYSGYGYSPYGYFPGYGWYGGNRPVVVVVRPPTGDVEDQPHGRVVNGRGYTQRRRGSADDDGASTRRASGDGGSSSSGPARSGGSTGSTSSGGSSSGGSTGRTAKPRSP